MPSTSPGQASSIASTFAQILPGAPTTSLQAFDTFVFRYKRYAVYVSGQQVNILSGPTTFVQALSFEDELVAIVAEAGTGKIAIAGKKDVWVLKPMVEGWTKVWWEKTLYLVREYAGDDATALSWGNEGELLVGGVKHITLFSTLPSSRTSSPVVGADVVEKRNALWSLSVPSALQYAAFSPSASIIASCGPRDRLVKIWRRLSFEEGLFDYTYLPHPGAVTHLEWRPAQDHTEDDGESGVSSRHDDDEEILYTLANDGLLRVWRTGGIHDLDILVLHTTIDLGSAIPDSPSLSMKGGQMTKPARYCFVLPSEQYSGAVKAATVRHAEKLNHSHEHLKETASKDPDVVVSLDGAGRMSAWGLQSIGHKRRPETPSGQPKQPAHIAHAEGLPLRMVDGINVRTKAWFDGPILHMMMHHFNGQLQWWSCDVESFFSPGPGGSGALVENAVWSGHLHGSICSLRGSATTQTLLSCSGEEDVSWWAGKDSSTLLHRTFDYGTQLAVSDMALLSTPEGGDAALLLEHDHRSQNASIVVIAGSGEQIERVSLPPECLERASQLSLTVSGSRHPPDQTQLVVGVDGNRLGFFAHVSFAWTRKISIGSVTSFALAQHNPHSTFLHTVAVLDATDVDRFGIVAIDQAGAILLHHVELSPGDQKVEPMLVETFDTNIREASIFAADNDYAAVVSSDGQALTVVNLRDGYIEHEQPWSSPIRQVVPSSKYNLVAISTDDDVQILVQGRYEHHNELPAWMSIKKISLPGPGLTITTTAWFGRNNLAIAVGNRIFTCNGDVQVEELQSDVQETLDAPTQRRLIRRLSSLASAVRKPLPVWHPNLISHSIRHGHWGLASSLIHTLGQKLKFWSEGDDLHALLDFPAEKIYDSVRSITHQHVDDGLIRELVQQLEEKDLPEVSRLEQNRLMRVVKAVAYCGEHVDGLDNGAVRFLFSWRLGLLHMNESEINGTQTNGVHVHVPEMHWREICFAYHSTTQQALLDLLIAHYDNKITWHMARQLGLFAWLAERQALEPVFEALAQSAYRAVSPPDPTDATLFYLALRKKPALLALWRIATWHKEQRATTNFLKRDISLADNKTAAKKNAYALMGKKRFDYAAAFFLLADDAQSATSVLATQCDDIMLAIAVARIYSGDGSDVLRKILHERLMPRANQHGDRWLASWCHSVLLDQEHAAEVLVAPLEGVRNWRQDDPNTLTLYRQLRKRESDYEYEAVLRAARNLRRMGMWLLALELVSKWHFLPPPKGSAAQHTKSAVETNGVVHPDSKMEQSAPLLDGLQQDATTSKPPTSILDGFTTPNVEGKAAREAEAVELLKKLRAKKDSRQPVPKEVKPLPTHFKEPDANSLLDSFGF